MNNSTKFVFIVHKNQLIQKWNFSQKFQKKIKYRNLEYYFGEVTENRIFCKVREKVKILSQYQEKTKLMFRGNPVFTEI